ncbi:amino acid decarboxylase [Paenibacillus yonginensis]|uniref:Amino acid decarboxylase n=1 Tax=Paenibacillus yonginensis TaxID=1462996 RepID=A0A1B1N4Q5_9BACL|nr:aminotransferase class I/II-fold pyridoxal phosphate-dependent enzyme [Paenibacillus yonginensis]ANS76404.1 amino acid decarboxylase [Paenibacillus yonginensis]
MRKLHAVEAPLWEALQRYRENKDVSFHVPGHKNGKMYARSSSGPLQDVLTIDATEITGLDDLHHPEGVIEEAQKRAARFFGAEETYFLVGGSTSGNLALILTACSQPGDVLLVQRNVHKSVLHGLMLARARAVFLAPEVDGASGLATMPSPETVGEALRRYPGAKGVLVTHPNYYGMGAPLAPLAALCHAAGVPLLVDEAHGAHYGLAAELPRGALSQGADGVVQSTHKMLGAMTMGAMLHVQGGLLNRSLLRQRLAMVQSSSPSYPIMASLDLCRSLLEQEGPAAFAESLSAAARLREGLRELTRIGSLEEEVSNLPDGGNKKYGSNLEGGSAPNGSPYPHPYQDPYKVVLYDRLGQWSGYKLQEHLERHQCVPEMSDERYTVLALGPGTTAGDVNHLLEVLHTLEAEMGYCPEDQAKPAASFVSTWNIRGAESVSQPVAFDLSPSVEEETEHIPLEQGEGKKAAEMVIPYPPGIPLLYPGETITAETLARLIALREAGSRFQAVKDSSLQHIQVYLNEDYTPEER